MTVDWSVLAGLAGELDDPEIVEEVVARYLAELPRRTTAVRAAAATGDTAELRAVARALRGSSSAVGARALADACRRVEIALAQGDVGCAFDEAGQIPACATATDRELRGGPPPG